MYPIPANATRIRYLESTGTQWIDTGIVPSSTMVWMFDIKFSSSGDCRFVGVGSSGTTALISVGVPWSGSAKRIPYNYGGWNDSALTDVDPTTRKSIRYEFSPGNQNLYCDGVLHMTSTKAAPTLSLSNTMALFACKNNDGTLQTGFMARSVFLYGCKIYDNGTLVRSFVPIRVGQVGYLFDRVSGELFGNAGTGAFVLGSDTFQQGVVPSRMMAMGVRKKAMKFIRSTGIYYPSREVTNNGSYLNTGINPDAQTSIEIICRVTPGSTFQHWAYLLGAQTANDNANTFSVRGLSISQVSPPWRNYRWGHSSWQDFGITTDSWSGSSDWHTISINRSGLVLDGVLNSATGTTNTSVPNYPIFVGCINRKTTAQNCIPLDIASLRIWNGSTLQFDGKPEVVNGVAGLKDSVSGSLFSSSSVSNPYQLLQEPAV